ncbi:type II secretion system protein GspM [Nitrincola alkalilacustris]|uniref:type II secretion system protein GspM n=1 Tax=Nitrincola alkalilacustris TaxID=1571224 RepID=UPI00124C5937|nr:type II secretion system protein GspM [Nitrincola alkalilacustris]
MLGIRTRRGWTVLLITGVAVLVALMLVLGSLWQAYHEYSDQVDALEPRIARLIGITQSHPELLEANLLIDAQLAELAYPASQDGTATGTAMQQVVRNLAQSSGMEVSGSQILPARSEGNLEMISLNLTLTGGLRALESLLLDLPTVRPLVFVDTIVIQPTRVRGSVEVQEVMVQIGVTSVRLLP